jgi:hypothetical protein
MLVIPGIIFWRPDKPSFAALVFGIVKHPKPALIYHDKPFTAPASNLFSIFLSQMANNAFFARVELFRETLFPKS